MRKKLIAANWKMHGNRQWIEEYFHEFFQLPVNSAAECVFFPPSVYIAMLMSRLGNTDCAVGGQNIYPCDEGAFTGEISAPMLKDLGCRYVLIGHSERRQQFSEDEKIIAEKFHHAKEHDMIPVLCVGETLAERERGRVIDVLERQLSSVLADDPCAFDNSVIAYEPVWAIGTGKTASPEQAQEMHATIRRYITEVSTCQADKISIIYGGSVNAENANALFSMPDIDGGLVGGASLNARNFLDIVECIR